MSSAATRFLALILLTCGAAACGLVGGEPEKKAVVRLETDDPAAIARTGQILTARFSRYSPHLNSRVESVVQGSSITFNFVNGGPPAAAIEYLGRTRGLFRLCAENDPSHPWVTEQDVVDAAATMINNATALSVRVDAATAQRLQALTAANVGKVVSFSWDGVVRSKARISAPFGASFQFPAPAPGEALYMATVLRSGALPTDVTSVELQ